MPATKKKTAKKTASKPAPVAKEHSVAESALKLVDEAAALLRKGISTSAGSSEKARLEAKQKAHSLLNMASSSLSGILDGSTSVLRKAINKL